MKKLIFVSVLLLLTGVLFASMTNKITYQGKLKEYGIPVNGTRAMIIRIWDASGSLYYTYDNASVTVSSGIFSVQLTPSIDWSNGPYYLETTVSGKTLSPKEEITAQMYALHSLEAENLKSDTNANFIIGTSTCVTVSQLTTTVQNNLSVSTITFGTGAVLTTIKALTVQKFTSGSGTYTLPTGPAPLYIRVRMVGGGGGGGSGSISDGVGSTGGTTSFGSFTAVGVGGGNYSIGSNAGGIGGTGGSGTATLRMVGGGGSSALNAPSVTGGMGGSSAMGGGAPGAGYNNAGVSANANTGGGGSGGNSSGTTGASGGGSEYVELYISNPSSTYSYTVGNGGQGGTTSPVGGNGGSGIIIVEEFYQ